MSEYIIEAEYDTLNGTFTHTRREEIVRCRDCANYHDGTVNGKRRMEPYCMAIGALAYGALFEVDENDFCSWAERREQ